MAELPWEDTNWATGDELTAQEWVNHVQEGHPEANSDFDITINANGNYEITHTPSGNSFVLNQDGTLSAPALSADQSITDPSGTQHTGELADSSDVFSGSHSDLADVSSGDHHSKTTSQSDLTDFHFDGERIDVQSTEPSAPSTDNLWLDVQDMTLKYWDGSRWMAVIGGYSLPDIADLHARYDATELSLVDGDSVSTWTDATGNGHDLTAGTAPTYQTGVINGNPAVQFDGTDDFLGGTFSDQSQPNHIFFVGDWPSQGHLVSTEGSDFGHSIYNGDTMRTPDGLISGGSVSGLAIYSAEFNGSDSVWRINGVREATGDLGSAVMPSLRLGKRYDGQYPTEATIGELIIYNTSKKSKVADIEQYLSDKWGITL